jgi:L-iditol 2-dehydrogenase
MKSAVLVANQKIEVQNRQYPKMELDECIVKINFIGVCSSDISRGFEGGAYHYPLVMGHELAGEIYEKGSGVHEFEVGQRVTVFPLKPCFECAPCMRQDYAQCVNYSYYGSRSDGGYCQFLSVKAWNLMLLPDGVSMQDGALTEPLSVVVHALRRAGIFPEVTHTVKKIAILGAGFLGQLAVQIIRRVHKNINLTVIDRNEFKVNLVRQYGVNMLCLKNETEWQKAIIELRNNYDIVIEASGAPENFIHSVEIAQQGGSVLWMGNVTGSITMHKLVVSSILRKEISIIGTWNSSFKNTIHDDWQHALNLMQLGIHPSKLITHFIDLDDVGILLHKMYKHKNGLDKFDHIKCLIVNS